MNTYIIENEHLRVIIREYGAELISVFDKKNSIEHLWQADETVWPWHAPVLFPVVGRCLNDEILVDGKTYKMEKHGFARKSMFKLLEVTETTATFALTSSEATKRSYPFDFKFSIRYELTANSLHCCYEVRNTNSKTLFFQLGGHPAFAVPFFADEKYDDYHVEFETPENAVRHLINTDGYFDGRTELELNDTTTLPLQGDMFIDDAIIFKNLRSRRVAIRSKNHAHALAVDFTGFHYLGLWAKPHAPYICVEPWLGCADTEGRLCEFSRKESVIHLGCGEGFDARFVITVSDS